MRSFEHLLVMAEECQLNFSFETKTSGEDTYFDKLLENERKVEWTFLSDKQRGAYFKLLIKGSGSKNINYMGWNVTKRSRTYEEDAARVEIMKTHAMLELHMFATTRKFTDWIIQYLDEMRSKIAQASIYQGEQRTSRTKEVN